MELKKLHEAPTANMQSNANEAVEKLLGSVLQSLRSMEHKMEPFMKKLDKDLNEWLECVETNLSSIAVAFQTIHWN